MQFTVAANSKLWNLIAADGKHADGQLKQTSRHMRTNSKHVKDEIRAHILGRVKDDNGEPFATFDLAQAHLLAETHLHNQLVIDEISTPFGRWPYTVDVSFHIVKNGTRDAFETLRVALPEEAITPSGEIDSDAVLDEVIAAINDAQ